MKTAISVDYDLVMEADRTAREIGVSRSRLFSLAMRNYLRNRRHEKVVEQLNRVYGDSDAVERRTLAKMKAKFRTTIRERW